MAYQGAAGNISAEKVWQAHELLMPEFYMRPDALAIIALSEQTYRRRLEIKAAKEGLDKIEKRGIEYARKVMRAYENIALVHPSAVLIDGNGTPEETFDQLRPLIFGDEHK